MLLKTTLDFSGSFFSFLSTIFFIRASPIAWPLGIVAGAIGLMLYVHTGIYADAVLHTFYLGVMVYGWHNWVFGSEQSDNLAISRLSWQETVRLLQFIVLGILLVSFILIRFTNSKIPFLDAMTTVLSFAAYWLACRKIIQNWYLWLIADVIYSIMYLYKGIPAHALVHFFYIGMAIIGYYTWLKKYQLQVVNN